MKYEIWARNPHSYIRELAECGLSQICWDRGLLRKFHLDAWKHANQYFPAANDFRVLLVGDQGTAELNRESGPAPVAVYPTWEYNQHPIEDLEWLMSGNRAEELAHARKAEGLPRDEIPVPGQEHRVVIIRPPSLGTGVGRDFLSLVSQMNADYPDVIVHYHGTYSQRPWSYGIAAIDNDLRIRAQKGLITFPSGKITVYENAHYHRKWLDLIGFSAAELSVPRNRCLFTIKSAQWACEHWDDQDDWLSDENLRLADLKKIINGNKPTPTRVRRLNLVRPPDVQPMPGDKLYCESCSYSQKCTLFRVGSVCRVPDTPGNELADKFGSRSASKILDALGQMLGNELDRYDKGKKLEMASGELDPNVSKVADNIMKHGAALAKLRDPSLQKPLLAIQMNGGNGAMQINTGNSSGMTERELASMSVAALEAGGVPRDFMTYELIEEYKLAYLDGDHGEMLEIVRRAAAECALPELTTSYEEPEIEDAELVE